MSEQSVLFRTDLAIEPVRRASSDSAILRAEPAYDSSVEPWRRAHPYVPVSQAMARPLRAETGPRGAIVAGRITPHTPFTDADLDMAETFAGQAAIALELSDARADQQRLDVLVDRWRIAGDLHDHVGCSPQGSVAKVSPRP